MSCLVPDSQSASILLHSDYFCLYIRCSHTEEPGVALAQAHSAQQGYSHVGSVVRAAVRTEGWRSLWRGLGPTLLRDVPFSGPCVCVRVCVCVCVCACVRARRRLFVLCVLLP